MAEFKLRGVRKSYGSAEIIRGIEGGDATPLHAPIALDIAPSACHLFNADGQALAPL